MRLYLLRHAIAVDHGAPGYARDEDRPLTEAGAAQARDVARGLNALQLPVQLILTSPLVRAVQTAEIVQRELRLRVALKELAELQPEIHPRQTSHALKEFAGHEHLLLVGHEPHLTAWMAVLTADHGASVHCKFKKAGVACIEVTALPPAAGSGYLRWLMTPKQLGLLGKNG